MTKQNKQQASGKGFGKSDRTMTGNVLSLLSTSDPTINIDEFDELATNGMPFWVYNQFEQFLSFNKRKILDSRILLNQGHLDANAMQIVRRFSYLQTIRLCVDSGMGDLIDPSKNPTIKDADLDRIAMFDCICLALWQKEGFPLKKTAIDVFNSYL
jgi:hypothetical protein